MIAFWVVAGVLSAAAAGLILQSAARAAVRAVPEDPARAVYRRQLEEVDDLAARGLIPEGERKATHAEAARRLLSAADREAVAWTGGSRDRRVALAAGILVPMLALAAYLFVGSPNLPDQPFTARVAAWRASEPSSLSAPQMAAVLRDLIAKRGPDVQAYGFLAQAELAADDPTAAARALRRAIELAPERVDLWEGLGEVLMVEADGAVTPQARRAFEEALARDPKAVTARFHLARARIEAGQRDEGLAAWRALAQELPAGDARRAAVEAAITQVVEGPQPQPDQMAAIRGMVDSLAARLTAEPNDPDGWVRLVRSYAVLGQTAQRDAALADARRRFAGDAEVQKALNDAARTEPMR